MAGELDALLCSHGLPATAEFMIIQLARMSYWERTLRGNAAAVGLVLHLLEGDSHSDGVWVVVVVLYLPVVQCFEVD